MSYKCPTCNGPLANGNEYSTHSLPGPWPAQTKVGRRQCLKCNATILCCFGPSSPDGVFWNSYSERMVAEHDYHAVGLRRGPHKLTGASPVVAAWAWHPMPNNNEWHSKLMDMLLEMPCYQDITKSKLLIIPPEFDYRPWIARVGFLFNEVWVLGHQAMLGSGGPYPSMSAESSIITTISQIGMFRVHHFWPSFFLSNNNYVPLESDQELGMTWGNYSRSHIKITRSREEVP